MQQHSICYGQFKNGKKMSETCPIHVNFRKVPKQSCFGLGMLSLPGTILLYGFYLFSHRNYTSFWFVPILSQELYFSKNNWRLENMLYPVLAQELYFPKRKFNQRTALSSSNHLEIKRSIVPGREQVKTMKKYSSWDRKHPRLVCVQFVEKT